MKRTSAFIAGLLLALGIGAYAALPSSIAINGSMVDYGTLISFLNSPTFPGNTTVSGNLAVTGTTAHTGAVTNSGAMTVTGAFTPTGGIVNTGNTPLRISNIPLGPVALASIGTNTADINGQLWISEIYVPYTIAVTKIGFLQGGTATTDNITIGLYGPTGAKITTTALAGVVLATANTFQEQTLLAAQTLVGPATYYIAVQGNGTAAGAIQTVPATYNTIRTSHASGTFGTFPATITLPTSFTTADAPVVYLF